MSAVADRYDERAEDYVRYWGPVLVEAGRSLLDRLDGDLVHLDADATATVVDVGTGAGSLAIEAATRWPRARVIGTDASSGMLVEARRHARRLPEPTRLRLSWLEAYADALPMRDGVADLVVSAFVYQLVPDRGAAFREAFRVLRPGARLGFVTWIDDDSPFAPADAFDEAVYDLGVDEPDEPDEDVSGDFKSAGDAADELRAAGFADVDAWAGTLEHRWDAESYYAYKESYAELPLFGMLPDEHVATLRTNARERLAALDADAFLWRSPIVYAFGRRPA